MNLKAVASALLIAGLAAPSAFAASTGTITFTGEITNVTCKVSGGMPGTGNPDFTVDIGPVNAADFKQVGDTAGNTGFRIYIGDAADNTCPNGTKVWATFDTGGTVDHLTGALKTTGGAQGVQIRLFNRNGMPIDIWGEQAIIQETIADHQAVLAYAAAYQSTAAVVAGGANSSVTYTVRYEP
jgi:major type 1 subunit fimbrin (pilin)